MLRSLLFIPAKNNMLKKIGRLEADGYIIDLEDSIEADKKDEALKIVEEFLLANQENIPLFVRLNADTFQKEAETLNRFSNIGFMLPKFENIRDYENCKIIWEQHKVIALIETPLGIINSNSIAKCDWIDGIAFGAEDYTSVTNMCNESELLIYQKGCLLNNAKAYGKMIFDTPSFDINCEERFKKDVNLSIRLGFDGKMAIHPKQIAHINSVFTRTITENLEEIIAKYEAADKAVQVIDGKVYEKMHIKHLKSLLDNGKSK